MGCCDLAEEKAVLEQKAAIEASSGEQHEELTPVDVAEGVYPTSFFDLTKYPTSWKLVGCRSG